MDKSILLEKFTVIGVNHRLAPVPVRELFAMSNEQLSDLYKDASMNGIPGMLVVSTCNRTEVLALTSDAQMLSILLTKHSNGTMDAFREYGFIKHGEAALKHFFRVSVGLEAQILGDLQIIKQVKEAYQSSIDNVMSESVIHRMMQSVMRTHKRSRNETSLGTGAATTAYAAVQMAKKEMKSFRGKKVLLVGAGKIGKVTCKNLLSMGAENVTIVNRSVDRAEDLGSRFNVSVSTMDKLDIELAKADLVICATGALKPVIHASHFELADPEADRKVLIDLSVPRNIAPDVDSLPFVSLINMDMLSDAMDETFRARESNIPLVENIINEEIDEFCNWLSSLKVVPTIKALNEKFDDIRKYEIERFRHKMTSDSLEQVEYLTRRIVNKIVAHSIEHLKENKNNQEELAKVLQEMYKIGPEDTLK